MNERWKCIEEAVYKQKNLRNKVLENWDGKCCCCGKIVKDRDYEIHHKKPKCFGGEDVFENLEILCKKCHKKTFIKGVWTREYNTIKNVSKELEQFKSIWITKEIYEILREQKDKQKISMAKIVCNLIIEKYGNEKYNK